VSNKILPYFKFFPRDWLTSPSIMLMSLEEEAAYLRMLCLQWEHGSVEMRHLSGMLGFSEERIQKLLSGPVGECFETLEDGSLRNPRLRDERDRAFQLTESRRAAARCRHDPEESAALAKKMQPRNPKTGAKTRRNAEQELAEAVVDWERLNGDMPERLRNAMGDYQRLRKERRMPLWGREMWMRNLTANYTPDEWAEGYETATRCGWASVHPKKVGAKPGSIQPRNNQFAALLEDELEQE